MEYCELLSKIENFAQKYCKQDPEDPKLWENHVLLVREFALKLAEIEGADKQVVEMAAMLHDIGKYKGRKDHAMRSYELSKAFLKNVDLPQEKKELVLKCIIKHRSKFSIEDNEIEVKVVQSADALGVLFDKELQERRTRAPLPKEETLRLIDKMMNKKINLESAREIAKPQVEKLKKLLK